MSTGDYSNRKIKPFKKNADQTSKAKQSLKTKKADIVNIKKGRKNRKSNKLERKGLRKQESRLKDDINSLKVVVTSNANQISQLIQSINVIKQLSAMMIMLFFLVSVVISIQVSIRTDVPKIVKEETKQANNEKDKVDRKPDSISQPKAICGEICNEYCVSVTDRQGY